MELLERHPTATQPRTLVSIVVPCHNEQENVLRLHSSLLDLQQTLTKQYDMETILVNDGSTDCTLEELSAVFENWKELQLVTYSDNRGIAAAILAGVQASRAPWVCTLDADGSYDPAQLLDMLDRIAEEVDVIVASPYHPTGRVEGLKGWRLGLSRLASILYRVVFRQQLYTYTSCCRVYRRAALTGLQVDHPGFVGITELLWRLDRAGYRIVEYPAVLRTRVAGRSKMRVLRVAVQHARFWCRALWARVCGAPMAPLRSSNPLP